MAEQKKFKKKQRAIEKGVKYNTNKKKKKGANLNKKRDELLGPKGRFSGTSPYDLD